MILRYYKKDDMPDFSSFVMVPKLLLSGEEFRALSMEARLLYCLLLDRTKLSAKNEWYDEFGRVYIYYSVDEVALDMGCGRDKALKLFRELDEENGLGLIRRKRQGGGKAAIIYVKFIVEALTSEHLLKIAQDAKIDEFEKHRDEFLAPYIGKGKRALKSPEKADAGQLKAPIQDDGKAVTNNNEEENKNSLNNKYVSKRKDEVRDGQTNFFDLVFAFFRKSFTPQENRH